ncbi:hypothetical protein M378DRAFT_101272 [Amanita muscaria Koide BX008]|uniref:NOT2/NOT3/NOT5 C-terminal domain-containing protein n=1 Tax=Amanita muscaria (strain Koide BX008) TaxID=946122 RepID=A0A0C2SWC2_AMAMK|nr:hypothetical protein M378DRAFT_101272 [Amanita muscaria Koide BX008]
MNRPGQPQQRPPSLVPTNPALSSQFRPPFPTYGMPPRNVSVLQSGAFVPGLQPNSHRTSSQQSQVQSLTPQPTPSFMQQRGQAGSFGFSGILGQHQPSSLQQQQQQQMPAQQQTNGAPSVSSASEVNLDPSEFPALGSAPATSNNSTSNATNGTSLPATSYASQAGLGSSNAGTGTIGTIASISRDFTPDDFPALGGQSQAQSQSSSQTQNAAQDNHAHPPGLNGFSHSDHSQHRANLLGALSGNHHQSTPGLLNLGAVQARNVHAGFQQGQTESEKQQRIQNNFPLKASQPHAAWNTTANASSQQQPTTSTQNGTHPNQNPPGTHLNAPPGVPPPISFSQPQSQVAGADPNNANPSNPNANAPPASSTASQQHPQTPAQQVLMSAADRWGLLGLLAMIKNAAADVDQGITSIGTDLGTMGLDMGFNGNLYPTFITPWADQSAAHTVEPDFRLPSCYANVQAPPPGPTKASAFSDETLFFMFYSSPRDALQEIAAQELYNRNWRYHKDLRLWITKESGMAPSQKVQGGEQGQYTYWEPENWCKERKEMTVMYADLEEKTVPAFATSPNLVLAQSATQVQPVAQHQVAASQLAGQVSQGQVQPSQRSFPISMTGL